MRANLGSHFFAWPAIPQQTLLAILQQIAEE
jgi:hypothetical protein